MDFRVDSEFASLIPPLSTDERCQLEANVVAEGCRDPLVVWDEESILLDGHNRYGICRTHNLEFSVQRVALADREAAKRWILQHQLGRRNLTPESVAYLRGKLYREVRKEPHRPEKGGQDVHLSEPEKTAERLADQFKVDEKTIRRDAKFSEQLDELAESVGEDFRREVLSRDARVTRKDVADLARLPEPERKAAADALLSGDAASVRDLKKQQVAAELAAKPLPSPVGKFNVIVIDPPWRYEKRAADATHRGRNPYPDMDLDAIKGLPVAARAEADCVLWLWTTNSFMREAFECLDAWGFEHKTILTWGKDRMGVGDWLRGKTEHCLLAVRGRPTLLLTNQTTLLEAPVREHSRKPDEFFAMVGALCTGTKLEMFAREPRDGWQAWGAETSAFEKTG